MRFLSATIIVAATAIAAAPAQAAICRHQPGQGAIDQYCEIIPSGAGERPDREGGGSASLPSKTDAALQAAGPEGSAVAALAKTSPAPQVSADGDADQAAGGGAGATSDDSQPPGAAGSAGGAEASTATLEALVGDLDGTGGGSWLPWALLGIATAAGVTAVLRRGRSS